MRTIPSILMLLFISLIASAKDPYPLIKDQDVLHYRYEIRLNDQTDEIVVQASIRIRLTAPQSSIILDLTGLHDRKGMQVDGIRLNEKPLPFTHQNNKLIINGPDYSGRDTLLNLLINYHGIPADGLIISQNKYGNRSFFGDNWPDRARNWLVCVDHPSDKASVEFLVTAPTAYQVVANGYLKAKYLVEDSLQLTHYESKVPLPSKVMVIGVGLFAVKTAGYVGSAAIESWVYPENKEEGFLDYQPAVGILNYFSNRIGPFAFEKLANVQSKTVYGGMENSGAIFYYENSVSGKNQLHGLLAHEIAHQWFGDAVSEADWHHIWLSEGFASYFEAVCLAEMDETILLSEKMSASRNRVVPYYYRNPKPVIDTTIVELTRLLSTNSYQKGAWVLHMLRKEIGEEAFWTGIQNYYALFTHRNALTDDFRKCMEEASGKPLIWFFDQWLMKSGHPILDLKYHYDPKTKALELVINQTQESSAFRFNLELELISESGEEKRLLSIPVSKRENEYRIPVEFAPATVHLDPGVSLLFETAKPEKN